MPRNLLSHIVFVAVTHRAGLTPVMSKTRRATRLCRFQFSIAMAISSPPIKSILLSFRYSLQTYNMEQGGENSDKKPLDRKKVFSRGGTCPKVISMLTIGCIWLMNLLQFQISCSAVGTSRLYPINRVHFLHNIGAVLSSLICTLEIPPKKEMAIRNQHQTRPQSLTVVESMMFIIGKSRTGRRAVTANGKASVHHSSAIRMITYPHWASWKKGVQAVRMGSTPHLCSEKATACCYTHCLIKGFGKRLFSAFSSHLSPNCRS